MTEYQVYFVKYEDGKETDRIDYGIVEVPDNVWNKDAWVRKQVKRYKPKGYSINLTLIN